MSHDEGRALPRTMFGPFLPTPSPPPGPAALVAPTARLHPQNFLPVIPPPFPPNPCLEHPTNTVVLKAYQFNGSGNFIEREWDIAQGTEAEFCWYHIQIDPKYVQLLNDSYAHILIDALCPPLNLTDIVSLVNDGTFCSYRDDGVLVFRINLSGLASGYFPFRIAARVSEKSLITVSLGDVPRLHYNKFAATNNLFKFPRLTLSRIPNSLPPASYVFQLKDYNISTIRVEQGRMVPIHHNLADLFSEARSVQFDSTVPKTMANLVVHVIDTHVDIIWKRIADIEKELNKLEDSWVNGNLNHNKKLLDDIRFPEMPFKLQRVLQVIAQTEQVLHQVKEECRSIPWLNDVVCTSVTDILSRSQVLREKVKILSNRVTAVNGRMDTIKSEQINVKVYLLSILSLIFLPFSIITGVFSMQVRGIPWTGTNYQYGFRNVLILGISIAIVLLLLYFSISAIYLRVARGRKKVPSTSMA